MSEDEINKALDDLEIDSLDAPKPEDVVLEEPEDTPEVTATDEDPPKKPPGFLSYEEWIEKGRDPADFRGENAYNKQYDALKEVRELKATMTHVVDGMETWKQQQNEVMAQQLADAKAEAAAEFERAKGADDIDAALAAQDKINQLDRQAPAVEANPVITEFASKNPIIDPANKQYDAEFHQDMIMIHNGKLDQLLGGDRSRAGELTQAQVERVQALAFRQTKELHPDKFVSPKNNRVTAAAPTKTTVSKGNTATKLKSVVGNSRNARDTSPANDIYELIKAQDPDAAETFAKNVIGE